MPTWPTSHQSNSLLGKRSANWAFFPKLEDEEVGNPLTPDTDQKSPLKSLLTPAKGPGSLDRQKTFRQLKLYASQTAQIKTVAQSHACWQMPRGENRLPPSQGWCLLAPQLSQCLVSEKAKQEARICIPPASNKALPASVETTHSHPTVTKCRSPSPLEWYQSRPCRKSGLPPLPSDNKVTAVGHSVSGHHVRNQNFHPLPAVSAPAFKLGISGG